ncbi:uncharacterized protein LOC114977351 isoform X2 [Acropora millepora]|uniref:uncharacterized protein LOC114977351 isoform X2 n=1 Tax=Acropora millepora TaxID=45264 RepID=UPI001CF2CA1F|nr:uncharacterized protein LOC114977351 isoform X2 [Acropora millepora]
MTYNARTKNCAIHLETNQVKGLLQMKHIQWHGVHGSGPPIFSLFCLCTFTEMHKKSHHELPQADTTNTSNGLHGWSRLDLSPFLSNCRLEMQFSIHNCTREFQGETASLLAYTKGQGTSYEQIRVLFLLKDPRMTCGSIIAPMSKSNEPICESHVVPGSIVDYTVPLHQVKKNRFDIASFEDIINVFLHMKFSDSEFRYAVYFPNHFEKD